VIGFVKEMRPDLAGTADNGRRELTASGQSPSIDEGQPTTDDRQKGELESLKEQQSSVLNHSSSSSDLVAEKVLAIVAQKTGYPEDMLEHDQDLEADLGIDTVKQAETFLALREAFDIPRQEDFKLRTTRHWDSDRVREATATGSGS
jgi:acyl carrier protein